MSSMYHSAPRQGRPPGMTLVELLISLVVITLLMGAFMWLLLAGKAAYLSSVSHSQNRQDLQLTMFRVAQEMRECSYNTITLGATGFSFLSARDRSGNFVTDASGNPVWQKYVLYYNPANTTKLLRREVYGNFSSALTQSQFTSYADGTGNVLSTAVAGGTQSLDATHKTCSLSMILSRKNDLGRTDQQTITITIFCRN